MPHNHIVKFIFVLEICALLLVSGKLCSRAAVSLHPSFRNYGTDEGLPSPEVYCIMQDRNGYMWFGTDNGASRFDGYTFTNYGPNNGLINNVVFDIKEDNKGNLWFGTMTGELFISLDYSSMHAYSYNHLILELSKKFSIANLLDVSHQGVVTIALRGLGILQIDSLGCEQLFTTKAQLGGLILKNNNNIWATSIGRTFEPSYWDISYSDFIKNVFRVEIHDSTLRQTLIINKNNNGSQYNVFALDEVGEKYLLQAFGNIYLIDNKGIEWHVNADFTINSLQYKSNGEVLLGMNNGQGLRTYKNIEALRQNEYKQLLEGESVSKSFIDLNGGFWVSTLGKGVFYFSNINMLVCDRTSGLKSDLITAIAIKSNEEVFIGTNTGLVYHLNMNVGVEIEQLLFDRTLEQKYVYDLRYDRQLGILYKNGWFLNKNNSWSRFKHKQKNVKSAIYFTSSSQSKNGEYLWGGTHRGFHKIDLKKQKAILHSDIELNITDRIYSIYEDTKGHLWIGLQTGIVEFINDKLLAPKVENPAFKVRVEDIAETPDSTLVFGTKGLGIIFWKENRIIQLTKKDGLTANMIEDIHIDDKGVIWVGTLMGLNKITYSPSDGKTTIRQITMAQGLPSNEIYQITSYDGQIWLATGRGAVKYHEPPVSSTSRQPIITNLECNSAKVDLTKKLFKYNENNLQIKYIAINYSLNGKVLYRYRLNNIDSWTETYNTSINLPALTPNTYTFEVQAQNEDEIWSSATTFEFTVLAPWWARWPFRLLVASLVVSMLILLYKNRIRQLKEKNEIDKKIYELEGKALQAQMNPHFISNCLTSIQSLVIEGDTESANKYLVKFAALIRATLMASRQGSIPLEDEVEMITGYLSLEKLRFKDNFDFVIEVDPEIDTYDRFIPPMLVQPFVENAVIHAFKANQNKGLIRIIFTPSAQHLIIKIIDNGVGISKVSQQDVNQKRVSVGIEIVKSRLALLNNTKSDNNVTFRELKDDKEIVSGTEVEILLCNQ